TSELLPVEHKEQLVRLTSFHDFIELVYYGESHNSFSTREIEYLNSSLGVDDIYVSARLDDDDALSINWLRQIESMACAKYLGHVVSLCDGYGVEVNDNGEVMNFSNYEWLFASAGMAYVGSLETGIKSVYGCGSHSVPYRKFPTVILA